MQTVSITEAAGKLPELVVETSKEPVYLVADGKIVAKLSSLETTELQREAAWRRLSLTCERLSLELETNLTKDGLTVDEFLADVLRNEE